MERTIESERRSRKTLIGSAFEINRVVNRRKVVKALKKWKMTQQEQN